MNFILHIGLNKTGTSSLQDYLHANRKRLNQEGILYPDTGLGTRFEGHGLHYQFTKHLRDPGEVSLLADKLEKEIAEKAPDTVVVSNEHFSHVKDVQAVARIFKRFSPKILLYLRRHDHWLFSVFAQAAKVVDQPALPYGFQGFVQMQQRSVAAYDFRALTDRWADEFGAENMIVRPYGPGQVKDTIDDVLKIIGKEYVSEVAPRIRERRNISPSAAQIVASQAVKRSEMNARTRDKIVRWISENPSDVRGRNMPFEVRKAIVNAQQESYAYIARTYCNDPSGTLFTAPLVDEDNNGKNPAPLAELIKALENI